MSNVSETKKCQNCQKDFTIEPDDFGFYKKIDVPPPTFCPECRMQRRLTWRNNMTLYNRRCDLCDKPIISIYAPNTGLTVYCVKCWWSDKWDPMEYGREYDFSRNFFEQFQELMLKVPHPALNNDNDVASVNCEYTQDFAFSKNCYMCFVGWHVENVMYSFLTETGKDMMDCMHIRTKSEWLYGCINCGLSYHLKNSELCKACIESAFLYNCINCSNCIMCACLKNKKYCFKNKQYSKEEYERILASYQLDTFSGMERAQKEYDEFIKKFPRRFAHNNRNVNCTGNLVSSSKNSKECFVVNKSENSKYCDYVVAGKECYDLCTGGEPSLCYEGLTPDQSNRSLFSVFSWKSEDLDYTLHCHSSKSLFGCVGLQKKSYCILNKKYSREEYEKLRKKIIIQMKNMPYINDKGHAYSYGEFYPSGLSPFGYNESVAQERWPLTQREAQTRGFKWQESIQLTKGKETLHYDGIPDSINEVADSILNEVLACIECQRNYKIIPSDLLFYQKMKIPIPRRCFYCRHGARLRRLNPFKLWHRNCMCELNGHNHKGKCKIEFETTYAPERPETVYCEHCYQTEMQ